MRFVFLFFAVFAPFAAMAADSFPRDLSWGLQNDPDVKHLQEYLRDRGFYTYPETNGNYFNSTRSAVLKFQQVENITPADGSFIGDTRKRLNQILGPTTPPLNTEQPSESFSLFFRDLSYGLRGDPEVVRLQEFLRSRGHFTYPESTGNYFTVTQTAVLSFQLAKKIPLTGSVDALTRAYINLDILTNTPAETPDESIEVIRPPETATSTYYKKINISSFSGKSTNPLSERITITNRSRTDSILVSGWKFETSLGKTITIPYAYNIPGMLDTSPGPLILPPGGRISITVGRQESHQAFRENICTGYFTQHTKFTPSISKQCPQIDSFDLLYLGDRCIAALEDVPRCSIPNASNLLWQSAECTRYMIDHLSYSGCVRDHRNDRDFFENQWYIWLQSNTEMFRNIHEILTLRDAQGKFVDQREY